MIAQHNTTQHPALPAAIPNLIVVLVAIACGLLISMAPVQWLLIGFAAMAGAALLLKHPEVALALFLVAGMLKADPRFSAIASVDLTLAIGALLGISCAFKVWHGSRPPIALPRAYLLYLPLVMMMLGSLFYTPNIAAGADKCARFISLTGLAILAPFILLDSPRKLRTFLYATAAIGFLISLDALTRLGGSERLTTEGGLTIQLGFVAGLAIAILWTMLLPAFPFKRRVLLWGVVAVPAVALIGSGARGPAIGAVCCVLFGLSIHRLLLTDAAILGIAGAAGLALIRIPEASYQYLGTLFTARSMAVLDFRNDLMGLAWQLIEEHPLLGVGIGGYPYYSPNPQTYGWPHNIFLELGAELGIAAAVVFAFLVALSFREALMQVRDHAFPLRNLSIGVLSALIFVLMQVIKSGDINDNRSMWLFLGLPFLLRLLSGHATPKYTTHRAYTPHKNSPPASKAWGDEG